MAQPETSSFSDIILKVGNSADPVVYTARMCGVNSKGITVTAATNNVTIPDCDDPEAVGWDAIGVDGLSATINLSGVSANEDELFWNAWIDSGDSKPVQYIKDGVGYRSGMMKVTNLGETVALKTAGNLSQRSITLQSDGAFPYADGDPD